MSHLLSVAEAQGIVDSFHPRVCETRERFDGEVYEREVYPQGPPPQVNQTYLIYAEGVGHRYHAIATGAGLKKYSNNQVEFELTAGETPLAHTINIFRKVSSFFYSGTKWYILSEDGGKLRTPQECIQIERQYQLRLATNELKNRLVVDATDLSHFPQLTEYQPDVQYATASCIYLSEEASGDIEILDNLLQELLKFEANRLMPMRQRIDDERDKAERQKREEAAKAFALEQARVRAEEAKHVEQQRQEQIQREQELQETRRLRQEQINKQREESRQKQQTVDKYAAQYERSTEPLAYERLSFNSKQSSIILRKGRAVR